MLVHLKVLTESMVVRVQVCARACTARAGQPVHPWMYGCVLLVLSVRVGVHAHTKQTEAFCHVRTLACTGRSARVLSRRIAQTRSPACNLQIPSQLLLSSPLSLPTAIPPALAAQAHRQEHQCEVQQEVIGQAHGSMHWR